MMLSSHEQAKYRLPTEAEWEFAAREGKDADVIPRLRETAWFANSGLQTRPVGSLEPNALGLFDMSGNVGEWCLDWHGAYQPSSSPSKDPTGPVDGRLRVVRGGAVITRAIDCRPASRRGFAPNSRNVYVGFRVLCEIPGPSFIYDPTW